MRYDQSGLNAAVVLVPVISCLENPACVQKIRDIVILLVALSKQAIDSVLEKIKTRTGECDPCNALYLEINNTIDELKKRYADYKDDKRNLPKDGPMSRAGHRQQIENKQRYLQKLINTANARGCLRYNSEALYWASKPLPPLP